MEAHNPPQVNQNPWGGGWDQPPPPPPPPPPNFHWPGPGFPGAFHHHPNGVFHGVDDQHFHNNFNANPPLDDFNSNGGCSSLPPFPRKRKFDCSDGGSFPKLYVVGVSRTATEEEIRHLFEEHGNVAEVVLLNDKRTGQQHEYCFVKYASIEEADRAISALHNRFTLPGAMTPIQVRYAVGERERLGLMPHDRSLARPGPVLHEPALSAPAHGGMVHKVYVNCLDKEASQQEIMEIFSSYGDVADVYVMRDDNKQSRGCGFVGFTHKYMAVAAINGLNGSYVMRGCERPLVVRFADPKKPKNGEPRPAPNSVDIRGRNVPNISSESRTNIQAGAVTSVANKLQYPASSEMQHMPCHWPLSPSRFSQMSLQQSQTLESPGLLRDVQPNSVVLASEPAPCAFSGSDLAELPVDCEWSEHICPDGQKYYFNCVSCESRWEKPEEFALYEQQLQSQQLQNSPTQEPRPLSASGAPSNEEECQTIVTEHERQSGDFEKPQLPMSCAAEHGHEQVQLETSSLEEPALVK